MPRVHRILLPALLAAAFGMVCTYASGSWISIQHARSPFAAKEFTEWRISSTRSNDDIVAVTRQWAFGSEYSLTINNGNDSLWAVFPQLKHVEVQKRAVLRDDLPIPEHIRRHMPREISADLGEPQPSMNWCAVVAGFPFASIYCLTKHSEGSSPQSIGGVDLSDTLVSSRLRTGSLLLPLRPLLPGFLLNTLFYAAIGLTVWFTPGLIRRRIRRARQRCPACGYDLRNLPATTCPECGKTSSAQPDTAAPGPH